MIRGVIIMNDQGKPRLIRFYEFQLIFGCCWSILIRGLRLACGEAAGAGSKHLQNRAENVSNFVKVDSLFGPSYDHQLAGCAACVQNFCNIYFVFIFDNSENELAMLDLMQVFVETLDKCFSNVCELDIVFNFNKVHTILDEIILGGQVLETSSSDVVMAVEDISKLEKNSNSIIPSIPGWQGR
ncbi:AP-3 complex subunit sigma [Sesamum angolense]|uniref:AP complex subunit sigma n=1 Tax=Sesamum angolense TaxID=2727404 RepID=A0AAE1X524_9LAMI|nr:AP-3 complex subunit sigma [Sesamum angolense]